MKIIDSTPSLMLLETNDYIDIGTILKTYPITNPIWLTEVDENHFEMYAINRFKMIGVVYNMVEYTKWKEKFAIDLFDNDIKDAWGRPFINKFKVEYKWKISTSPYSKYIGVTTVCGYDMEFVIDVLN